MRKVTAYAVFFLSLSGCVSLNSHQTGRTLGKGNKQQLVSANFGSLNSSSYGRFLIVEAGMYWGVSEHIDLGLRMNASTLTTGSVKLQVAGDKKSRFASSLGVEGGFSPLEVLIFSLSSEFRYSYAWALSSYSTYYVNERFSVSLSPRFMLLRGAGQEHNFNGYAVSFTFGKTRTFSVELAQFVLQGDNVFLQPPQMSLGFTF